VCYIDISILLRRHDCRFASVLEREKCVCTWTGFTANGLDRKKTVSLFHLQPSTETVMGAIKLG
jgi:hypothetical protein